MKDPRIHRPGAMQMMYLNPDGTTTFGRPTGGKPEMSTHDMLRDCVDDPNITTILNLLKSVHRRLGELEKHYD